MKLLFKNLCFDLLWITLSFSLLIFTEFLDKKEIPDQWVLLFGKWILVAFIVSALVVICTNHLYIKDPVRFQKKIKGWGFLIFIGGVVCFIGSLIVALLTVLFDYGSFDLTHHLFFTLRVFMAWCFFSRVFTYAYFLAQ